jgi:DNA-binding beta-propeller fold protein YncE
MTKIVFIVLLLSTLLLSCIKQPTEPLHTYSTTGKNGAFILSEGIWGMDNSLLSRYSFDNDSIITNYYEFANPGLRLGDLANDIVIWKQTAYIVVTTARTIEAIDIMTGKSKGRLILDGRRAPRKIAILSDSLAAVTDLYDHSLTLFNPSTFKTIKEHVLTGPAPEGIQAYGSNFYVVNSGYGDYLQAVPKASTISVIDAYSGNEHRNIPTGINPMEVVINPVKSRLYVAYYNLPSKPDSLGGIIEYDLLTLTELNRWRCQVRSLCLSATGDSLFFLSRNGVDLIDLQKKEIPKTIISNPKLTDIWYSLAYSQIRNALWVGNSRNHQISGEILIYSISYPASPLRRFYVGLNPGKIVFY